MTSSGEPLDAIFARLDVCVFERDAAGEFRVLGTPPTWALALREESEDIVSETGAWDLVEAMPFLEGFLPEAEEAWAACASGASEEAHSGTWTQEWTPPDEAEGERRELVLEARAFSSGPSSALLLLQRVTRRFEEKRHILQLARGALLDYERLRKEVDRKELLLHCIVHDLRGPLSGMVGTMSLVQSRKLSIEDAQELLEVGLEQARYQESMIQSVLEAFASEVRDLESFEATVARAPDLRGALESVSKRYASAFRSTEVELALTVDEDLPTPCPVVGRADRLERVLENLLENALRYSPPGTAVAVEATPSGASVLVTVTDQGPGIPPDVQPRLFEKFSQGRRSKGVAGLGLYFCRSTLELWGGGIEYVPREGRGACFRIRLRVARDR